MGFRPEPSLKDDDVNLLVAMLLFLVTPIQGECQSDRSINSDHGMNRPVSTPNQHTDQSQPKILFAETELDFGTMEPMSEKTKELCFLNDGDADLVIEGLTTNCACTPALISKKCIKPGEEGKISITLSARFETYKIEGSFLVHSNDPEEPSARILLVADVETIYVIEPEVVNFGVHRLGDPEKTMRVRIEPQMEKGSIIGSFRCSSSHIEVSRKLPASANDRSVEFSLRLLNSSPPGRFKSTLTIETDHPRFPTWEIPIIGNIKGPVCVEPTLATLGTVKPGAVDIVSIRVYSDLDEKLEITNIHLPDKLLNARVETIDGNKSELKIHVSALPDIPSGMFDEELTLEIQTRLGKETKKVRLLGIVRQES